ncbi:MAG: hypothetical protein POH28_15855 [Acidocella sp.]|nr:hypothetical protein [Acidocella sp.]
MKRKIRAMLETPIICMALSLLLYFMLFGLVLDRPLSLGILRLEMEQKAARLATLPAPKLVILAGSNGPYSHSCVVMGAMLHMPCENAGIAVGIGLDDLFARDAPFLHRGDVVYMPMELQQYTTTQGELATSVDGGMLFRHNWRLLGRLGPRRWLGAMFCCDLADGLESLAEMGVAATGVINPAQMLEVEYNTQGDRVDNGGPPDAALLSGPARAVPAVGAITHGYGTRLIRRFVVAMRARGVVVIGGLPTDFNTVALPSPVLAAVRAVYRGGPFLLLPNESRYPPADFFNSEDHLRRPYQLAHSVLVARGLGALLGRAVLPDAATPQDP